MGEKVSRGFHSLIDPCWAAADLLRLTGHEAPSVRYWALRRLDDLEIEIPDEVLRRCLGDADEVVAGGAAAIVGAHKIAGLADGLAERLARDADGFGLPCAGALADLGDVRVLSFLRRRSAEGPLACDPGVWLALSKLKGPEATRLLKDAFAKVSTRGAAPLVSLLAGAFIKSDPSEALPLVIERWLDAREEEEADVLLAALLPAAEFEGDVEEFRDAMRSDREASWPGLHEAMVGMLSEHAPLRLTSEAARAGRKGKWERLMEALAPIADWLEVEAARRADGEAPLALVRALEARCKRFGGNPDRARDASALMLLDLVRIAQMGRERAVTLPHAPEDRLHWLLSDAAASSPETAGSVFDHLTAEAPQDTWIAACLRAIGQRGGQATTAVELLGAWHLPAAAAPLAHLLGDREDSGLAAAAGDALVEIGEAAVEAVVERLGTSEDPVLLEDGLGVCALLPSRRIVEAICSRFETLFIHVPEPLLSTIEILGAREFLEPLGRELREDEVAAERAFAFLCQLHAVADPRLEDIRRRLAERVDREARAAQESGRPLDPSLELGLQCNGCRRTYTYVVREILVDPEAQETDGFQPFIKDRIRCKGCGRENDYSLPQKTQLLLMHALAFLTERSEREGVHIIEQSPFRFVKLGLSDGRKLQPREARKDYEERLARRPDDPDLLIGYANVLRVPGKVEEAETALRRALSVDPTAADAYATLGQFAEERGDLATAEEMYRHVAALGRRARFYRVKDRREFLEFVEEALIRVQGARAARPPEPVSARERLEALIAPDGGAGKIGRNDPCPCGSGKKYKKCCLTKAEDASETRRPEAPDQRLRQRLMAYAESGIPQADMHRAMREFFGERFDLRQKSLALDPRGVEADWPAFLEWLIHDFRLSTGRPAIAQFLMDRGSGLPADERAILEEWQDASVGLQEVVGLDPGRSLTLRDVFTGETRTVREVRGSLSAARWDLLGARLIQVQGEPFLSGTITIFHPKDREGLVRHVTERYQKFCRDHPGASWREFFRVEALVLHRHAERLAREARPPQVHTPEGHPIMLGRLRYDVRDPRRLLRVLAVAPDFEETTDPSGPPTARGFAWVRTGPAERYVKQTTLPSEGIMLNSQRLDADGTAGIPGLATLSLVGDDLKVEAMSAERLAWVKARLAELAGDAIRLRADVIEDPMEKLRAVPEGRPGRETASEIPPEVRTRLVGQMLHRHFTAWLDQTIPALDGRTPRQAARDMLLRPRLIQILREVENAQDRERQQGKPWYDAAWMWETLGIPRTEA
jgi:tetratricopeptide (TPR) repeat protein